MPGILGNIIKACYQEVIPQSGPKLADLSAVVESSGPWPPDFQFWVEGRKQVLLRMVLPLVRLQLGTLVPFWLSHGLQNIVCPLARFKKRCSTWAALSLQRGL